MNVHCKKINTKLTKILTAIIWFLLLALIIWPRFFFANHVIAPLDLLQRYYPWRSLYTDIFTKNLLRSDVIDAFLPRIQTLLSFFQNRTIPLWNPLEGNGRPFLSLLFNGFLNPIYLLSFLFPNPARIISVMILLKFVCLGISSYLLLRQLKADQASSLVGSTIFTLSGFNLVWLSWNHTLVACFAPFLFLGIEKLIKSNQFSLIITFSVAFMLLAGFPSVAAYYFYLAGAFFLFRSLQVNNLNAKKWILLLFKFVISVILGVGLTGLQLLPSLEFLQFINIGYRRSSAGAHLPLRSIIQLIIPNFFGNPALYNWQGPSNFNESTGYTSVISIGITAIFLLYILVKLLKKQKINKENKLILFFVFFSLLSVLTIYDIGLFLEILT